jgi:Fe-S-cluster-containing dehydrogenase component
MNACRYDALYIDPRSETAAKCNFGAHRAEWGWPELAVPTYARSHVSRSLIDHGKGEYLLRATACRP